MKIDLSVLNYKDRLEFKQDIDFPKEYYENSDIKRLEEIHVEGFFRQNDLNEYTTYLEVKGKMQLLDSVSLEPVLYDFSFTIDENIEEYLINTQNTLDLLEFLWQNIVLEVPIRYTKSDATVLEGENWKLINEEEERIDPRMQKLLEIYKGGE